MQCKVDDVTFDKLGSRRSVFDGKPTTVYVPRDSKYEVTATGSMMLEIGVCKVKARKKYEAFVIDAGDVTTEHRGNLIAFLYHVVIFYCLSYKA